MLKWINKKRNKKGFTLVELVVVIAILGILAGIAVPKLGASRKRAAITAHNANVKNLMSAATMYIADKGVPTTENYTWTKNDSTPDWGDYLQEWPNASTGTGAKYNDGSADKDVDGVDFTVTISKNGDIVVTPGVIK